MNIYASIAICFIPLAAVFICFVLLVPGFKTRWGLLACLFGLLAVIPIATLQFGIEKINLIEATSLGIVLLEALVLNGLIEESLKMGLLFVLPSKDIVLSAFFSYAILSGLSVGCFESVIYLISGYENIGLRMITAVIIHASCTGLGGLFVYSIRNKKVHVMPFIYAVLFHGIYNYFAGFNTGIKYFSFAVILFALIECRIWYRNCLDSSIK
jgi:RsiW-degrading membrane proteinase PrsW (M82 family)